MFGKSWFDRDLERILNPMKKDFEANISHFSITEDVLYLIFQHLNARELKSAMLVSKQWFTNIVTSSSAMRKFVLKAYKNFTQREVQQIISSPRHYTNIVFGGENDEILRWFAHSLYSLKVLCMPRELNGVVFSNLQVLDIWNITNQKQVDSIFEALHGTQLKSLSLGIFISKGIIKYLKSHRELIELSFAAPLFILDQDVSFLHDLKLKKLKLRFICSDDVINFGCLLHTLKLVESQAGSLQYFSMNCDNLAILKLVMKMKIKCLDIKLHSGIPCQYIPINTTIECAKIDGDFWLNTEYKQFLAKLPNLKQLYYEDFSKYTLKVVVSSSKQLKEIFYTRIVWEDDISAIYDRIKNSNKLDVNRSIELKKVKKGFEFLF